MLRAEPRLRDTLKRLTADVDDLVAAMYDIALKAQDVQVSLAAIDRSSLHTDIARLQRQAPAAGNDYLRSQYEATLDNKQQQLAKITKDYDVAVLAGGPQARQAAEQALKDARKRVAEVKVKWAKYAKKQPKINMKDPYQGMRQMWIEYNENLAPLMAKFAETLPIKVNGQIQVPGAPVDPNQIPSLVVLPLGTWSGTGKLNKVLAMFPYWERAPRVVLIDSMNLQATNPNVSDDLTVSFNATMYMFIEGIAPPAVAAGQGQMGGGMMGGGMMGGGMPGGGGMMGGGMPGGGGMMGGGMPGGGGMMGKGPGMMGAGGAGMPGGAGGGMPGGGGMMGKGPGMMGPGGAGGAGMPGGAGGGMMKGPGMMGPGAGSGMPGAGAPGMGKMGGA